MNGEATDGGATVALTPHETFPRYEYAKISKPEITAALSELTNDKIEFIKSSDWTDWAEANWIAFYSTFNMPLYDKEQQTAGNVSDLNIAVNKADYYDFIIYGFRNVVLGTRTDEELAELLEVSVENARNELETISGNNLNQFLIKLSQNGTDNYIEIWRDYELWLEGVSELALNLDWQDSPTFTNLEPYTQYYFTQRVAGDAA